MSPRDKEACRALRGVVISKSEVTYLIQQICLKFDFLVVGSKSETYNSTVGRKSILECNINPYELVSSDDFKPKDKGITLVNGQRIRVRPSFNDKDYEEILIKPATPTRTAPPTPKEKHSEFSYTEIAVSL